MTTNPDHPHEHSELLTTTVYRDPLMLLLRALSTAAFVAMAIALFIIAAEIS